MRSPVVSPRTLLLVAALAAIALAAIALAGCGRGWRDEPYPAPAPRYQGDPTQVRRVTVTPGDTVYSLSRRLGVPIRAIIESNNLAPPFQPRPGQVLTLPPQRVHVVAPGDTLYALSRRYGPSVAAIANANGLAPPYVIRVGEPLVIPAPSSTHPVPTPAPGPAPGPAPTSDPGTIDWPEPVQVQTPPSPPLPSVAEARRAVPVPEPPPRTHDRFLWPVQGEVAVGFGPSADGLHNDGLTFAVPAGAPIRAAESGVVTYSGDDLPGFGTLILVRHAEGWITAYAHADHPAVQRGQVVRRGQVLARAGHATGSEDRPRVHFQVRKDGRPVDPRAHLEPRPGA